MQRHSKEDSMEKQPSNRAENQIRPFTVGRKNWLFSDTPAGAKASAVIYSIVETAKANSLVPRDYIQLSVFCHNKAPPCSFVMVF